MSESHRDSRAGLWLKQLLSKGEAGQRLTGPKRLTLQVGRTGEDPILSLKLSKGSRYFLTSFEDIHLQAGPQPSRAKSSHCLTSDLSRCWWHMAEASSSPYLAAGDTHAVSPSLGGPAPQNSGRLPSASSGLDRSEQAEFLLA